MGRMTIGTYMARLASVGREQFVYNRPWPSPCRHHPHMRAKHRQINKWIAILDRSETNLSDTATPPGLPNAKSSRLAAEMGAILTRMWVDGEGRQCRLARSGTIGSADLAKDGSCEFLEAPTIQQISCAPTHRRSCNR